MLERQIDNIEFVKQAAKELGYKPIINGKFPKGLAKEFPSLFKPGMTTFRLPISKRLQSEVNVNELGNNKYSLDFFPTFNPKKAQFKADVDNVSNGLLLATNGGLSTRMGATLLSKNGALYYVTNRSITNNKAGNINSVSSIQDAKQIIATQTQLVPDGVHIFVIAMVNTPRGPELQLRTRLSTESGHGQFIAQNETDDVVVAAGEFATQNGRVVLIDNKSGKFGILLSNKNLNQKQLTVNFFKNADLLHDKYTYVDYISDRQIDRVKLNRHIK